LAFNLSNCHDYWILLNSNVKFLISLYIGEMIKIIIVDDHKMFRESLRNILTTKKVADIIGEAENGEELIKMLDIHHPDVILMDISMPKMNGIEATKKAIQKQPDVKVLALSGFDDDNYYFSMVDAGAKGFVLKNAGIAELKNAINDIYQNKNWFSSELLQKIIHKLNTKPKKEPETGLSERELDVLKLICESHTNEQIAERLFISFETVKYHRANILSKTGCTNTAGLVMYAIKNHLIEMF
jgi:DNA-binding NarL/FixJ family response regulator